MKIEEVAISVEKQELKYNSGLIKQLDWLLWNWDVDEVSEKTPENRKWWEFWKLDQDQKRSLLVVGRYLIEAVDDFVNIIKKETNPSEYKATVLDSISTLYDRVIKYAKIPIWIKPFGKYVKSFIINTLCSLLIDFLLRK